MASCQETWNVCLLANGTGTMTGPVGGPKAFALVQATQGVAGTILSGLRDGYGCKPGLFLPAAPFEEFWAPGTRAALYFILLMWLFLGIAIAADVFVAAIERITSLERTVTRVDPATGQHIKFTTLVWNKTVANLTLMALGSSAPEILLATIEAIHVLGEPPSDGLGPGTIVGSAGYNLFVITAVCTLFLQKGQSRRISDIHVFVVTAVWSLLAYLWLLIVVSWSSPGVVELWEALVTLLAFPVFVFHAYMQSKQFKCGRDDAHMQVVAVLPGSLVDEDAESSTSEPAAHSGLEQIAQLLRSTMPPAAAGSSEADARDGMPSIGTELAAAAAHEDDSAILEMFTHHSIPWSRLYTDAVRSITGGGTILPSPSDYAGANVVDDAAMATSSVAVVSFVKPTMVAYTDQPLVEITLARAGRLAVPATVQYTAWSTSSASDSRQEIGRAQVCFEPGQTFATIPLPMSAVSPPAVADSDQHSIVLLLTPVVTAPSATAEGTSVAVTQSDETGEREEKAADASDRLESEPSAISIDVSEPLNAGSAVQPDTPVAPQATQAASVAAETQIGEFGECRVLVLRADIAGTFEFESDVIKIAESCGVLSLPVRRSRGGLGRVVLKVKAIDGTATQGPDYKLLTKSLVFEHEVDCASVQIAIRDTKSVTREVAFQIHISLSSGKGAKVGSVDRQKVVIVPDAVFKNTVQRLASIFMPSELLAPTTLQGQFWRAMSFGTADSGPPSIGEGILHFLSFFWKVLFAFIPPPSWWSGYPAFIVSLTVLGILTSLVNDAATIFACATGIPDIVTALIIVAAGTSVPDTFASLLSARHDPDADDAVGNITGSNSVNVLLGLGLPWTVSAIYHQVHGTQFQVIEGPLGASVASFLIAAAVMFAVLYIRRRTIGEIGGPTGARIASSSFYVALWVIVVTIPTLTALNVIAF